MGESNALELVGHFQRCKSFPKDEKELARMAEALVSASRVYGVSAEAIVKECLDTSEWCPTDAELRKVAEDIRGPLPADEIEKDKEADAAAFRSFRQQVPTLPDGQPDMVEWTANCIRVAVKSHDHPPNADANSRQFWAESVRDYLRTHPRSVQQVRAGGDVDREEIRGVLAARAKKQPPRRNRFASKLDWPEVKP